MILLNDPFYYSRVDHELYGVEDTNLTSRGDVLESYIDHALRVEKKEGPRARTVLAKVLSTLSSSLCLQSLFLYFSFFECL